MPAVVEVKFYNSFLLRKTVIDSNTAPPIDPAMAWNGSPGVPQGYRWLFSSTHRK